MALTSLPALLAERAAAAPEAVILRRKDRGIWKPLRWRELAGQVAALAGALAADGFGPGMTGAILSDTRVEWLLADLALQQAGGAAGGLSPLADAATIAAQLRATGTVILFVENEEQLDKVLTARAECPALRRIVIFDMKGLRDLDDAACIGLAAFAAAAAAAPRVAVDPDAPAAIVFTEGSGRAVTLSHRRLAATIAAAATRFGPVAGDERLAVMPPAHTAERVLGLYLSLATGTITNFGESADTVVENLREAQPTVLLAAPAQWKRFHDRIERAAAGASWLQRALFHAAMRLARGGGGLAARPVLGAVRRALGLARLRLALIAGGTVAPDLIAWFRSLGIDLVEIYGIAESGGLAATPGRAAPPVAKLRLSVAGEIEIEVSGIWIATGDSGALAADVLTVHGRCADAIAGPDGRTIHPAPIENALRLSPFILDALVMPGADSTLAALLRLDPEAVEAWAHARRLAFTSYAALTALPELAALLQTAIDRVNAGPARAMPIRAVHALDRRLAAGDPELTSLGALRRDVLAASCRREPATTEETT